jgi:hypothetical protein
MLRLGCVETDLYSCVACRQISVQSTERNEIKFDSNSVHCLAPNTYGIILPLYLSDD